MTSSIGRTELGQFTTGNPGRPVGSKNGDRRYGSSQKIHSKITRILQKNIRTIQLDLDLMEPKDRVECLIQMSAILIERPTPTLPSDERS